MIVGIVLTISLIVLIILLLIIFLVIHVKLKRFLKEYFDSSTIKEAYRKTELQVEQTPKSFSSMEDVYLKQMKRDFPEVNLSELKSMSEACILDLFHSVEKKDISKLNKYSSKIISYAEKMIEDSKGNEVSFDNIKFHKTALTNYKRDNTGGTVTITSSLEYNYKIGNKLPKKTQDRIRVESVYVLDKEKYGDKAKSVGVNCPNCGAVVKSLGEKKCDHCGTSLGILVSNTWIVDNIIQY